jgi:hypothetical protein
MSASAWWWTSVGWSWASWGPEQLDGGRHRDVGEAMDPAPDTVRPSAPPKDVLDYMGARGTRLVVTTPDGELIGIVHRPAVERCLAEKRAASETPRFPCAAGARSDR